MNLNQWRYNSSSRPMLVYTSFMEKDLLLLLRIISTWNVYFFPERLSFSIRNNYPLLNLSLKWKADDFLYSLCGEEPKQPVECFHMFPTCFNICVLFPSDSTWKSVEHIYINSPKFYLGGSVFTLYLISALPSSIT